MADLTKASLLEQAADLGRNSDAEDPPYGTAPSILVSRMETTPNPTAPPDPFAEEAEPPDAIEREPEPEVHGSRVERHRRVNPGQALLVILLVTVFAGALRFTHLSNPHDPKNPYVFDEVYYAKDGCYDAGFPWQDCKLNGPGEQTATVHPPLGRWIIAGGEAAFGNRPFGWRFSSAVAGTLSVLFVSILGLLLFDSALWAGVSGLLLATENLNYVQSRMSMLDIFVCLFAVLGFLFLALDRRWIDRRTPEPEQPSEEEQLLELPPDRPPSPIFRPWRLAAGVALGAAAATKWSGATALLGALLLTVFWERTRRKRYGRPHPLAEALAVEAFSIFVFLIAVPIAVYLASYARYWADNGTAIKAWWDNQVLMGSYSIHLRAGHPYASRPWKWILMWRPVAYYYQCTRTVNGACKGTSEVIGMGNPLIFWAAVLALPYAVVRWLRTHDWRAGLIFVAFASQWLPWFLASRTSFFFYMTPITPFLVLAVVYALRDMSAYRAGYDGARVLAPVAAAYVVLAVAAFAFFFPILNGRPISYQAWQIRVWFRSWV